jgi:two-component system OmpR family response regulator
MRVLVVEDNQLVAQALQRGLKSNYAVDVANTAKEGLNQAESTAYDLILLDLNLPDMSGKEVCQSLRKSDITAPILILTASVSVNDKVALLDAGADDYITKPFSLEEVRARIRASLRRMSSADSSTILKLPGLELDPAARTVHRKNKPVELRRKEFDILEYLMRNHGKTLTRSMIVGHIWDMSENLWANVVDVHIKHLRDKIDRPFGSHLIKTVHGVGYKLEVNEGV